MALSPKIQKELDSFFNRAKTGDICEINYDWTNQSELGKYCYYQRVKYKVPCTAYRTRTACGTWKYNVEMHSFTDMINLNYSGFSNSEYVNLKLAEEKSAKEKEMTKTVSKISDKLKVVNESFTVNMYDNGYMIEIGGKDSKDDWKTAKITVSELDSLIALIKEAVSMERDN